MSSMQDMVVLDFAIKCGRFEQRLYKSVITLSSPFGINRGYLTSLLSTGARNKAPHEESVGAMVTPFVVHPQVQWSLCSR
jgi:hypothetical protein